MSLFNMLSPEEIKQKILESYYKIWFSEHRGYYNEDYAKIFGGENLNTVKIQKRSLEDHGLIYNVSGSNFQISKSGIDEYERIHPNEQRVNEMDKIIAYLKTKYEEDCDNFVSDSDIKKEVYADKDPSTSYLLSQMKYLECDGKIVYRGYIGGNFHVRLSNFGYESSM